MLKNYGDFPQSLKEMPDDITEIGHNHIFQSLPTQNLW